MSSFESLYRGCENRYHFEAQGTHQEMWQLDIGISNSIHFNGSATEIIKAVAEDCFKHMRGEQRDAQIVIEDVQDIDDGQPRKVIHYKLCYQGEVEDHNTDEPLIANVVLNPTTNHRVLLERFSQYDESEMTTFAKFKRAFVDFFAELFAPFETLSLLWEALTGRSEKEMRCDLNLLAEVCGTSTPDSLSMTKSLKYMIRLLSREKEGIEDPNLERRLRSCLELVQKLKKIRKKYNSSSFQEIVTSIQKDIEKLPVDGKDKLLIPVGFHQDGKLIEMFLEIKKSGQDTCTVSLISQSDETLDLFDREVGVGSTTRSFRREIANVSLTELKGKIPLFVELQANPDIKRKNDSTTREAFLFALQFKEATVSVGRVTEKSLERSSFGHVAEMMSYVREELFDTTGGKENAERFEVATRLRFFLDFCKKDKRWLRNQKTRELVRTTAFRLMEIVESNRKELIGEEHTEQNRELAKIVAELTQLMQSFDDVLPVTVNLRSRNLGGSHLGEMDVVTAGVTPRLQDASFFPDPYVDVDPPFTGFDANNPAVCLKKYAQRCQALMKRGEHLRAGYEAHQMVLSLPPLSDQIWAGINDPEVISSFETIGKTIVRGALQKDEPSFRDAMTASLLNAYAFAVGEGINGDLSMQFLLQSQQTLKDLENSRLPVGDKLKIKAAKEWIDSIGKRGGLTSEALKYRYAQIPENISHPLVNLSEYAAISSMKLTRIQQKELSGMSDLKFTFDPNEEKVKGKGWFVSWERSIFETHHKLLRRFPDYASHVAEELGNRYVTELCPLKCSNDNCVNWGGHNSAEARKGHQFYPLYMLYHFTDEYCTELYKDGILNPDEIRELLLLQQTNKVANRLYYEHNEQGRYVGKSFEEANKFSIDDRRIQVMTSLGIYLRHPNFFRIPELRWFLETKVLKGNYFSLLLKNENIDEHLPFLLSAISALQKEVKFSHANQDMATAGYLVHLLNQISESVEASDLDQVYKDELLNAIKVKPEETIVQWLIDSSGKTGETEEQKQKELIPYVLHYYLNAYQKDPQNEMFKQDKHLEILAVAIGKYEWLCRLDRTVDPLLVETFYALKTLMMPKFIDRIGVDNGKSGFINKVINRLHPEVADLDMLWNTKEFPLCTAKDGSTGRVYQFDMSTGKMYLEGERVDALPSEITRIPEVEALFGDSLDDVWKIEEAQPDLSPKAEIRERVIAYVHEKYPGHRIVVAQELDIKGYPTGKKADIRVERDVNYGQGNPEWATYHRYDAQDLLARGEPLEGSDLPPKVVAAIGNRSCWVSPKGDKVYVFDPDEDTAYGCLVLDVKKKDSNTGFAPIKEFRFTGSERLVAASDRDLEKYASIEEEGFIMVTGDKGRPCRLEYPRLTLASNGAKLTYSLSNSKGDSNPHFPGYALARLGVRPGIRHPIDDVLPLPETFDHFQLLRSDGSEIVLIPGRQLQQQYSKAGERLPKCSLIPPEGFDTSVVFDYEVDAETNRLKAKSGDAYAYLAYVAMAHQDYLGAQYYLNKANQATGFSSEYLKIFKWIQEWKDDSDNGKALKLQAAVFHDKVIEELKQESIRGGKDSRSVETDENRFSRLKMMTALYKSYRALIGNRTIGLTGFDPMLDLAPEAEERVLALCYEYVDKYRDDAYQDTVAAQVDFKRAKAARNDFTIVAPSNDTCWEIGSDALLLWANIGKGTSIPEITYGRSEWILENFGHAYRLILELDMDSAEYHELLQKIRFLSLNRQSSKPITKEQKAAVQVAQSYLLRLAAKRAAGDTDALPKKFPEARDPFFGASRSERLERANNFMTMASIDQLVDNVGNGPDDLKNSLVFGQKPSWAIKYVDRMIDFKSNYREKDYQADAKKYLQSVIYGSSNIEAIREMDAVLQNLKDQPLRSQIGQLAARDEPQLVEDQPVTILEHYRELFENPPEHLAGVMETIKEGNIDHSRKASSQEAVIVRLEETLSKAETPEVMPVPTNITKGFHAILGDQKVAEYQKYYTKKPSVVSSVDESVFDTLESSEDPAVVRLAQEHRADLKAYQDERKQVSMTRGQAKDLRAHLVTQKVEVIDKRQRLKKELLDAVNQFDTPAGILAMRRLTGKANKPTLDFLINLWRDGQLTLDWEQNPLKRMGVNEISVHDLQELDQKIAEYMEVATTEKHLDRVIHATDVYLESCGNKSKSTGDQQLAQSLVKQLETRRFYTYFVPGREITAADLAIGMRNSQIRLQVLIKLGEKDVDFVSDIEQLSISQHFDDIIARFQDNEQLISSIMAEDTGIGNALRTQVHDEDYRDLLFLEYQMGIVMWKPQVDTYRGMLHNPDLVRQLGMGWGKSKTLLPLLAKRKATGKNLVMLMLPEALYETNCRDLEATNRELFGQGIFRFDFNRKSDRSVISLQNTYIRLLRTVNEKGYVTTTKNSMLSFRNAYFEFLHKLQTIPFEEREAAEEEIAEMTAKLRVMSKILVLFAEQTDVIADEVDACLDVRKEVNFAMGIDDPVDPLIHDAGAELMEIILSAESGSELFELREAILSNNNASIPPEKRVQLMADLAGSYYGQHDLNNISKEEFVKYFMNETEGGVTPQFMEDLKAHNPPLYKKLAAAKAFLHQGYGSTLGRVANVNYGRDPVTGLWTIPYKASNTPSIGSEYDDTIERVSYTIQDYIQNGVSFEQVFNIVADMRNRALQEMAESEDEIVIDQTKAAQEFKEFIQFVDIEKRFGERTSLAAFDSNRKIRQLLGVINGNPKAKLSFMRHYVLPKMKQSPLRVNAVSDDVVAMVHHFGGFSGTLPNRHAFNDRITSEKTLGTDGRSWFLLILRDVSVKTFSYDSRDSIGSLLDGADIVGNYQATIDTGAYLRGTSNQEYMHRYLEKAEEKGIKGAAGIYFDKSGKIAKQVGKDGRAVPIDQAAETDFMSTHTLYDQSHTVGADIKQGRKAKAVVTVGENTFTTDLFQAIWRLRQLNEEQNLEILVSDDVKKMILAGDPDRDLTINDILGFCLKNEARKVAEDVFRAEKGKIQGLPVQTMFYQLAKLIADTDLEEGTVHDAALTLGHMFTKSRPKDEAFDEYARPRTEAEPNVLLEEAKVKAKVQIEGMVRVLQYVIGDQVQHPLDRIKLALEVKGHEVESRKNPDPSLLPVKVDRASLESGQQVELEAQVEMQLETMAEVDQQQQAQTQVQTEHVIQAGTSVNSGAGGKINPTQSGDIVDAVNEGRYDPTKLRVLSDTIGAFDDGIFVSAGLERKMSKDINPARDQYGADTASFDRLAKTIFYTYRKAVTDVLIVKNSRGEWSMVIPTIHEAQAGCRDFVKYAPDCQAVQVQIGGAVPLVKFKNGNDRTDALPFDNEEDKRHFYRLYVQAKFFNGEISYGKKEEKEALKEWLTEKGPKACRTLFERHILPAKPKRYEDSYLTSSLAEVFKELIDN